MGFELTRTFVVENEWFWRINENATSLTLEAAVRDFVAPLLRLLQTGEVRIVDNAFELVLGEQTSRIELSTASDRVAVNHLVGDLNRALSTAKLGIAFALVVPRRYELRGAVVTDDELGRLAGDPVLLVPSSRPSWKAFPVPTI
ncbi:hypothetical protein BH11MYX3_BH11MYX3_25540 [soil metagenome]